ncbi:unnamed protein product [Lactuca saligna]|uniref:Uncharacterized protein n=1 Tax=Lactuca saligna TaxID=75948 RepID=A0AA35YPC0_LACSI|nr:unnamed protein product [Lactuca saligna]
MLNQLQCVLESSIVPKQRGETVNEREQPKPQQPKPRVKKPTDEQHKDKLKIDLNVNEASGSKGKEKLLDDDKIKEELFGGEKQTKKSRDKVLDDLLTLRQELEAKEAEEEVSKVILATRQTLFPLWTLERIQREEIDDLSVH